MMCLEFMGNNLSTWLIFLGFIVSAFNMVGLIGKWYSSGLTRSELCWTIWHGLTFIVTSFSIILIKL